MIYYTIPSESDPLYLSSDLLPINSIGFFLSVSGKVEAFVSEISLHFSSPSPSLLLIGNLLRTAGEMGGEHKELKLVGILVAKCLQVWEGSGVA